MTRSFVLQLLPVAAFLLAAFVSPVAAFQGCRTRYGRRGCYDKVHEGVLVVCDGRGTEKLLPRTIPADTVYLSLTSFRLDRLRRSNFSSLPAIECIHFADSFIDGIDSDAFADLESLHEVEMATTEINGSDVRFVNHPQFRARVVSIHSSPKLRRLAFNGSESLEKLTALNLDDNEIGVLGGSVLSRLGSLERLSLRRNALRHLDWVQIADMRNLNQLYLDGNDLQSIPFYVLNTFRAVKDLKLGANPFHCNCKLRWLKEFYMQTEDAVLDYDRVICSSPFSRPMSEVPLDDFACSKPSKPEIEWYSLNHQFVVNCSSKSDPAPSLNVKLPGVHELISPPAPNIARVRTQTPLVLTSSGFIECIATNSEGESSSSVTIPSGAQFLVASITSSLIAFAVFVYSQIAC